MGLNMIPVNIKTKGIEVGVWEGANAVRLLTQYPLLHLIGIDPFEGYQDWWGFINTESMRGREEIARKSTEPFGHRFEILAMRSDEALRFVADGDFDFVYIDGDHSFEWAKHDIFHYWSKVKPGGVLCGHDRSLDGVLRALRMFTTQTGKRFYETEDPQADSWFIPKPCDESNQ